jgi:hypothetical protein
MTAGAEVDAVAAPVRALVERVFGAVMRLREGVLGPGEPARAAVEAAALRAAVQALLAEHRDIIVGMGMIIAPGVPGQGRRRILWWQDLPGRAVPTPLQVDLNPHSLGFYDYGSADWFSVPRDSGDRHIDGPYVDVHGTDRYLLTFTMPVRGETQFLGVLGADVPVGRFEGHLLRAWGPLERSVVIVNAENRVVVSNSARALAGDLYRPDDAAVADAARIDLTHAPWRLYLGI